MENVNNLKTTLDEYYNTDNLLCALAALTNASRLIDEELKLLKAECIAPAQEQLAGLDKESGEFEFGGHRFTLNKTDVYDFMERARRYREPDCVRYRELKREQDALKSQSKAKTTLMKAIMDNFAAEHPDWKPEDTIWTLSVKN